MTHAPRESACSLMEKLVGAYEEHELYNLLQIVGGANETELRESCLNLVGKLGALNFQYETLEKLYERSESQNNAMLSRLLDVELAMVDEDRSFSRDRGRSFSRDRAGSDF